MSHREDLQKLISLRQRHLQKLKEQQAAYGLASPAHLLLEIEDTETELPQLQAELAALPTDEGDCSSASSPTETQPAGSPPFTVPPLRHFVRRPAHTRC